MMMTMLLFWRLKWEQYPDRAGDDGGGDGDGDDDDDDYGAVCNRLPPTYYLLPSFRGWPVLRRKRCQSGHPLGRAMFNLMKTLNRKVISSGTEFPGIDN